MGGREQGDVGSRKRGLRGAEVLGLSSSKDGVAVAGFGKAERGRTGATQGAERRTCYA